MSSQSRLIRIGAHPNEQSLFVLRRLGLLEERLARIGAAVEWVDYKRGPDTATLVAERRIDLGGSGSTIPIQAQAGGVDDLVYVAVSPPRPRTAALLVPAVSPLNGLADLAGRRIVLLPSYLHFFHRILHEIGAGYDGAIPATDTADGYRAVLAGDVDAWLVSGVGLVEAERRGDLRALADLGPVISNRSIWYARGGFIERSPDLLQTAVAAIADADAWVRDNPAAAATIFSREVSGGRLADEWLETLRRRPWGAEPPGGDFLAEQQLGADLLADAGVIPRRVTIEPWAPGADTARLAHAI